MKSSPHLPQLDKGPQSNEDSPAKKKKKKYINLKNKICF